MQAWESHVRKSRLWLAKRTASLRWLVWARRASFITQSVSFNCRRNSKHTRDYFRQLLGRSIEVLNQDTLLVCLGECWYHCKSLNCYADNDTNFFLEAELSLSKQNPGPNANITLLMLKGDWHYFTCCKLIYVLNVPKVWNRNLMNSTLKAKAFLKGTSYGDKSSKQATPNFLSSGLRS